MHTCIACIFVRVCTYMCMRVHLCMCVRRCMWYVCACVRACVRVCVCVYMFKQMYASVCTLTNSWEYLRTSEWHCFHNCAHYFVRITLDTHFRPQHARCMMVLSFVLNMSKDPDPGVCSAAVRTLGVFVTYPSLSEVHTYVGTFVNLTKFYNTHFMYEFVLCVCITNLVLMFFLIWNFPFHW